MGSFCLSVFAQVDDNWVLRYENLTVEDRLPSHRVLCVCQDQRGFMWFGTEEGLCRYDGFTFREYVADINNPASISNNAVRAVVEDQFGNLWIGTDGGGLNYFKTDSEEFFQFALPEFSFEQTNREPGRIYAILRTDNNSFWIGSYGQGLYVLPKFESVQDIVNYCQKPSVDLVAHFLPDDRVDGLHDAHVFCLYEDSKGQIWVGTDDYGSQSGGALHRIEILEENDAKVLCQQYRSRPGDSNSLGSNYIMSLYEDRKGRLWVSNWEGGLNLFDETKGHFVRFSGQDGKPGELNCHDVYGMVEDDNNNIWVATYGGGISRLVENQAGEIQFIPYTSDPQLKNSLVGDYVRQIFKDNSGILWVITWKSGISRLRVSRNPFEQIPLPGHLAGDTITEVVERMHCIPGKGIVLTTDQQYTYQLISHEGADWLFTSIEGHQTVGDELLDTEFGMKCVSDSTFVNLFDSSRVFLEDSHHNLWIGKGQSLYHCFVNGLGVNSYKEYTNDVSNPASLKGIQVTGIAEDKYGQIWISTFDALNRFDPQTEQFIYYTMKDGLPGNAISCLLADDNGFLWLATENGLARFDPESGIAIQYNQNDGMPFTEFATRAGYGMEDFQLFPAYCKLTSGEFVMSSVRYGLLLFHPDEVFRNDDGPPIWITELHVLNRPVYANQWIQGEQILQKDISFLNQVALKASEQSFSLVFSALDFFTPDKTSFAYRLLPLENEWIHTSTSGRQVTYSHLPPGDYQFELRAANAYGVWNNEIRPLTIQLLPEWYQSSWFKLTIFLLVIVLFTMAYILLRQRSKIYNELQLERLRREESDKFSQMRTRFYTNVTHEFRTPLTLILGPLNKLNINQADSGTIKNISIIQKNANRLLSLVNQLMDFRKIEKKALHLQVEKGDLLNYVRGICELFRENAVSREIDYQIHCHEDEISGYFDPGAMDKIIFNLLSNAFKFTGKQGRIHVSIQHLIDQSIGEHVHKRVVGIKIEDNGKGISQEMLPKIFDRFFQGTQDNEGSGVGLSIVKGLVDIHHGKVTVNSESGRGSLFTLLIPINRDSYAEAEISNREDLETELINFRPADHPEPMESIDTKTIQRDGNNNRNGRLLIVEDNPEMRWFIADLLQDKYLLDTAGSAERAMELIDLNEPELILSDVMMPGIGGLGLVKELKSDVKYSHIPIVLITALSGQVNEIEALTAGADEFISKPFDPEILKIKVNNRIKNRMDFRKRFAAPTTREVSDPDLNKTDQLFLERLMSTLEQSAADPDFTVRELVHEMGMSHSVLFRKVKALTGQNLNEMLVMIRLENAYRILSNQQVPIKEVAYQVGFNDPKYFSTRFKKKYGLSPSELLNSNSSN